MSPVASSSIRTDDRTSPRGGVILVGNLPDGPLVGGIEVGVEMLMHSDLVPRHGIRLFNTARVRDPSRPLRERLAYQMRRFTELTIMILRTRPRLVHVKAAVGLNYWQSIGYCCIARLLGRRVVLQLHGGDFDTWYQAFSRPVRSCVRASLRVPHHVIVLSEYWRRFVQGLAPRQSIRVIPNGVRIDDAHPRPPRTADVVRVVTVGALGIRKGHFDIIEVASQLDDAQLEFVFAGTDELGGEEPELRARAAALGVTSRVVFAGPVTGAAKWALLARSDIFLLPSRAENMPNALLEAMAAGLPIISSPVGAVGEMLDGCGLLVPAGDVAAIGAALRKLVVEPALRERLGRASRARAEEHFSFAAVARALDALYSEAKQGRRPAVCAA